MTGGYAVIAQPGVPIVASIWDFPPIVLTAQDDSETIVRLPVGSLQLLLAGLDEMGKRYRWTNYPDDEIWDETETLIGKTTEAILSEIDFCQLVADCVDSSETTQSALAEQGANSGATSATGGNWLQQMADAVLQEDMLPDDYSCDDDLIFGMAKTVVESIHLAVVEIFQKIETATNAVELSVELADNVPIAEAAAIPGEIVAWIQDTMYEEYNAAWSLAVWDEIACQLFCAMKEEDPCKLSLETITGVYTSLVGGVPASDWTFVQWFDWILGLELTVNEAIVKVAGIFGLAVLRFGSVFGLFGLGVRSLQTIITLARDDSDPDWPILCDACPDPEWIATADLEVAVLPALCSIPARGGSFVPLSGVVGDCYTSGTDETAARIRASAQFVMRKVDFYYELTNCGGAPGGSVQGVIDGSFGELPGTYEALLVKNFGQMGQGADVFTHTEDKDVAVWLGTTIRSCYFNCGGSIRLKKMVVFGSGDNPFDGEAGWVIS